MGFRNPVLTAVDPVARQNAADALDQALNGIIPGSRLAADAVDGKTVTGATVQTAAAGARSVLRQYSLGASSVGALFMYTGFASDTAPAQLYSSGSATSKNTLISNGQLNGVSGCNISLFDGADGTREISFGAGTVRFSGGSKVIIDDIQGDLDVAGALRATGPVTGTNIFDTGWLPITLAAGWTAGSEGAHYKVRDGVLHFHIHATRASWAAGAQLLIWGVGNRPSYPFRFPSYGGGLNAGELTVFAAGDCYLQYAGTTQVFVSGTFPVT